MSDRIAVMNAGQVEQLSPAKEIYDRPRTAFVASFVGDNNIFAAEREPGGLRLPDFGISRPAPGSPEQNGPLMLAVRPEHMRLRPAPAGGGALLGTVTDEVYLGSNIQYTVQIGGRSILATMPCRPGGADAHFAAGDKVEVDWDVAAAVLVPADRPVSNQNPASDRRTRRWCVRSSSPEFWL
jgi:ABC-type Fe3+/spermidine/putrescine transport system ATPase subunit